MNNYELIKEAVTSVSDIEQSITPGDVVPQKYHPSLEGAASKVEESRMRKRKAAPIGAAIGGVAGGLLGPFGSGSLSRGTKGLIGAGIGVGVGALTGLSVALADEANKIDEQASRLKRQSNDLRKMSVEAKKAKAQEDMAGHQGSIASEMSMQRLDRMRDREY
jgi:hypothetical protein